MDQEEDSGTSEQVDIDISSPEFSLLDSEYDESKEYSRFQGPVPGTWMGVKGCCDADRINQEANAAFRAWVNKTLAENPRWRLVHAAALPGGSVKCKQRGGGLGGSRSCYAELHLTGFIEYETWS